MILKKINFFEYIENNSQGQKHQSNIQYSFGVFNKKISFKYIKFKHFIDLDFQI